MERQITHLTRLVDDLLEVSRITQGRISLKREPLLLGAVVYGAAEAVASSVEDQSQTLTVDIPKETVWLCGDPTRLSQVIVNVLNNSIKYTPARGSISLSADIDEEQISISIRDTGAGISQELLPHIFDLFTQGEQTLDRSNGGVDCLCRRVERPPRVTSAAATREPMNPVPPVRNVTMLRTMILGGKSCCRG